MILVYGSERLGTVHPYVEPALLSAEPTLYTRKLRRKEYELKDHLGNVRVVISDLKRSTTACVGCAIVPGSLPFVADIKAYTNYYPFGMEQKDRSWSGEGYRYGYNGMEKDDELKGEGNSYDYGARMYDARIGRWLSLDPFQQKYVGWSPYNAFGDNPILFYDPDGRELKNTASNEKDKQRVDALIAVVDPDMVKFLQNLQLTDDMRYVSPEDGSKVGMNIVIEISVENIDDKVEDYDIDYRNKLLKNSSTSMLSLKSGKSHLDAVTLFNFDWDREVMTTEGITINGEFKSWEDFDSDEEAIEAIKTYGEAKYPITFRLDRNMKIVLDDAPSSARDERLNFAHELGGIVEQVNNLPTALYYAVFKKNRNGERGDSKTGHEFEKNPHAIGAEKGEKKEKERINNGQ